MPDGDEDEFGVRLHWPEDDAPQVAPTTPESPASSEDEPDPFALTDDDFAPAAEQDASEYEPEVEWVSGTAEELPAPPRTDASESAPAGATRALLPTISGRLHDLEFMVVRLNDTVAPLIEESTANVEQLRRQHERAMSELRRSVQETDTGLRQLAGQVAGLADDFAALTDLVRSALDRPSGDASSAGVSEFDGWQDALAEMQAVSASLAQAAEAIVPADDEGVVRALDDLRREMRRVAAAGAADSPVLADLASELAALRDEVTQLKRRVGVRGKTSTTLDDDQVASLVDRVAERLQPPDAPVVATLSDRDLSRIIDGVLEQIERTFEVVPEPAPAEPAPARAPSPERAPAKAPPAKAAPRPPARAPRATKAASSARRSSRPKG
jgi:ElaB/YqjD/DUF883 family membrane-anchored ribosome-binding protein